MIRTNDEAWRVLPSAGLGEHYQAAFKLSRATGVLVRIAARTCAAGDEGSRQQRLAEGLLSDASTVVCYHQHPGEVTTAANLLGLSSTEAEFICNLADGEALWRVLGWSFEVQHVLSDREWELVATDAAMSDPPAGARDDRPPRRAGGAGHADVGLRRRRALPQRRWMP